MLIRSIGRWCFRLPVRGNLGEGEERGEGGERTFTDAPYPPILCCRHLLSGGKHAFYGVV